MKETMFITIITVAALIISIIKDPVKTKRGVTRGIKMFVNLLPTLLTVLIIVSVIIYIFPKEVIIQNLGENSGITGMIIAAMLGSIALIPGFIAFPLGSVLLKYGISYKIISIFLTTLMMVGILTLPVEIKYFGFRVAVIRNVLSFIGAIIIGVIMGFVL